jgi:hypothetical protein
MGLFSEGRMLRAELRLMPRRARYAPVQRVLFPSLAGQGFEVGFQAEVLLVEVDAGRVDNGTSEKRATSAPEVALFSLVHRQARTEPLQQNHPLKHPAGAGLQHQHVHARPVSL